MSGGLTKDVDLNSGSGTAAAVGGLDDVGGAVISLGLGNGNGGVSRLGVDGNPVVWLEDQVSFRPFHAGLRLTLHLGRELDLAAALSSQTSQQLDVQLDLWRFCMDDKGERSIRSLRKFQLLTLSAVLRD